MTSTEDTATSEPRQSDALDAVGDSVDRLITLDFKGASVGELYIAARAVHQAPPTLVAAQKLAASVTPLDTVIVITGAIVSPFGTGETDGPIGTAALARTLSLSMKARPLILTMRTMLPMVEATIRAAGLNVITGEQLKQVDESMRGFAALESFPIDDEVATSEAKRIVDELRPSAVISIESTGPNSEGIYHNYGRDYSSSIMKAGRLFAEASSAGVLTIGVGDRGNEVGFGTPNLHEAARRTHPYGVSCRCPCGAGAADVTPVDVTVVATVSNWGAYGIEANLSAVLRSKGALHDGIIERRMLDACSRAGGVDGRFQTPDYLVDSLPEVVHVGVVEMLRAIVAARVEFEASDTHDPYGRGKY